MARLAGESGEVHGEERAVGGEEGDPEMELAESLVHEPAGHQGEPIVDAGEDGEGSGHGHDEMKMRDDEVGVVQIGVEHGLSEDGAGEASGDEERDEADGRRASGW